MRLRVLLALVVVVTVDGDDDDVVIVLLTVVLSCSVPSTVWLVGEHGARPCLQISVLPVCGPLWSSLC